jgi:hypothetical protein
MLSKCANARCSKPFLRLSEGKLFLVETTLGATVDSHPSHGGPRASSNCVERYWLCDDCAKVWTLIHDRHEGIALIPLPRPVKRNLPLTLAEWDGVA